MSGSFSDGKSREWRRRFLRFEKHPSTDQRVLPARRCLRTVVLSVAEKAWAERRPKAGPRRRSAGFRPVRLADAGKPRRPPAWRDANGRSDVGARWPAGGGRIRLGPALRASALRLAPNPGLRLARTARIGSTPGWIRLVPSGLTYSLRRAAAKTQAGFLHWPKVCKNVCKDTQCVYYVTAEGA